MTTPPTGPPPATPPACAICGDPTPPGRKLYCGERCSRRAVKRSARQRQRDLIRDWKTSRGCAICGLPGPYYVLELHHLSPPGKVFEASDFRSDKGTGTLVAELSKCAVLCAVHHRMVEAGDATL